MVSTEHRMGQAAQQAVPGSGRQLSDIGHVVGVGRGQAQQHRHQHANRGQSERCKASRLGTRQTLQTRGGCTGSTSGWMKGHGPVRAVDV